MRRVIVAAVVCALITAVLRILSIFEFDNRELVYTVVSVVFFAAGAFFLKAISERCGVRKFFRLYFPKLKDSGFLLSMTALVISGNFLINLLTVTTLDAAGAILPDSAFTALDPENFWLSVLTVAVIPAIAEEFFFRGAVMSAVSRELTLAAVLLSSFFFAAVHGSLLYFLGNFYAGVVFSVTAYVTGSSIVSAIAHFLNNIISYLLFIYSARMSQIGFDSAVVWILLFVFLVALYNSVSIIGKRRREQINNTRPIINEGELIWEEKREKDLRKK